MPPRDIKTKIVVIGAGPAGLSAAYFLRQQGYREVLVLEKQGHPGGLCRSITEDYRSFDLGANYVTPAYRETLNLADMVGAELYTERPLTTIDLQDTYESPKFVDPWITVRQGMAARLRGHVQRKWYSTKYQGEKLDSITPNPTRSYSKKAPRSA